MGAIGTNSGAEAERGTAGVSAFNLAGLAPGTNSAAFGLKDILLGCDKVIGESRLKQDACVQLVRKTTVGSRGTVGKDMKKAGS